MRETQTSGMQKHPPQWLESRFSSTNLTRCAIQCVSHQRMPCSSKMRPNLVRAPRTGCRFDEREILQTQQDAPVGLGGPAMRESRGHARSALRIACDLPRDRPAIWSHPAVEQSDIGLGDNARPKLLRKDSMGSVCARHDHGSGSAAVKTVHNSRAEVSAQTRKCAEMMEQRVHQGASSGAGSCVNNHSRRLIHHDHIFVFVEHVKRDLFWSRPQRGTGKDRPNGVMVISDAAT